MTRYQASFRHLLISIVVFSLFLSLVFFVWYAHPYNLTQGIADIVYVMAVVDVVLGPFLTLILYKEGKWGLKFDLTMIAIMQISALLYGANVIYQQRPGYVVFSVNQFQVVSVNEIEFDDKYKQYKVDIISKPKLIFAEKPTGQEASDLLMDVLDGKSSDIDRLPKYYRDYKKYRAEVLSRATAIPKELRVQYNVPENWVMYPVVGKKKDIIALVNQDTAEIESFILEDPWPHFNKKGK